MHLKCLFIVFIALFINGCVSSMKLTDIELEHKLKETPLVTFVGKAIPNEAILSQQEVEIYYKSWNPLTAPDAIKNWEHHFKIGNSSSPDYNYQKIAKIEHYQLSIDDSKAEGIIFKKAKELGGTTLISYHREPVIDNSSLPAKIKAYKYMCTVVKKI